MVMMPNAYYAGVMAGVFCAVGATVAVGAEAVRTPLSTPPGITLIDVISPADAFLWRSLGGPDGQPLFTHDADSPGKSVCDAACATEFPPYIAAAGAAPFGEWSLVRRDDGKRQWAYRDKPLYFFAGQPGKTDTGQRPGGNQAAGPTPDAMDPGSRLYAPKDGWRRASFDVAVLMPPEVELKSVAAANGYAFVVPRSGMTMYVFSAAPRDPNLWTPVYAPTLSTSVGDFTIVLREDGKRQWAYKQQLLYTYKKDYTPGDTQGLLAQADAQVALATRHFVPPELKIQNMPLLGPTMVTAKGMSVYTQTRYRTFYGGRTTRNGFWYNYEEAKAVGTRGCVDECTKMWKPVVAPKNARPSGFWEVAVRPDGARQWAYKGAPLYTYAGDAAPGDDNGNNRHEIIFGDVEGKVDLSVTGGDRRSSSGSGFYWRLVAFFN